MKQKTKTPAITAKLQKAVGDDVNLDDLAVYEAIAFNTLPIRKSSALYNKAVAERGVLLEMAERLSKESLPVQIMHDGSELPVGRVFFGEVQNTNLGSELRVLFYVGKDEAKIIEKIDAGIVDQVSVSILPKQILCSDCGFDFLGASSTFENVYSGKCAEGHTLGQGHTHAQLVGLDQFNEMSLVGRGGAQNARIVSKEDQRLAASDSKSHLFLNVNARTALMELEALVAQLTDAKAADAVKAGEIVSLKATIATLTEKVTALQATIDAAPDVAAKDTKITGLQAELDATVGALSDIAKRVLVASGDTDPKLPAKAAELVALITEKSASMSALIVAGGKALEAASKSTKDEPKHFSLGAFRSA
jgi:hypothetical protein